MRIIRYDAMGKVEDEKVAADARLICFEVSSAPCLRTVTSDRKICYGPQLTPMHNDVVIDVNAQPPPPSPLQAHCLLIVCDEALVPLTGY
jgi:hypothetical protein